MSNVTKRFLLSPLMRSLARITSRIIVAWVVVLVCIVGTFLVLGASVHVANATAPDPLANLVSLQGDTTSPNHILVLKITGVIIGDSDSAEATTSATRQ